MGKKPMILHKEGLSERKISENYQLIDSFSEIMVLDKLMQC